MSTYNGDKVESGVGFRTLRNRCLTKFLAFFECGCEIEEGWNGWVGVNLKHVFRCCRDGFWEGCSLRQRRVMLDGEAYCE